MNTIWSDRYCLLLRKLCLFLCLAIAFTACVTPQTPPPAKPEENFAFVFRYGSCTTDILDTVAGTYTRDMIVEPAVTVVLRLSDVQMRTIYQQMVEIDFFAYPEVFAIPTPRQGQVGIVTPSTRYEIEVRNGEVIKGLVWQDDIFDPTTREADNLRALFQLILKMIEESPAYQNLPERPAGCV